MKKILYIATIIVVLNSLFWEKIESILHFRTYEMVFAFFIVLLCTYLFLEDKKSIIKFVLFSLSLNNFLDETRITGLTPFELGLNEILTAIVIVTYAIYRKYAKIRGNNRRDL